MAFIGTFCSPCARCKVELFIKYLHTSLISHSIKTPACSTTKQAGVFFLLLSPILSGFPQRSLCGIPCRSFLCPFASESYSDIGSANICPRCSVLASSVREIDSSHLFGLYLSPLDIIRCSIVLYEQLAVSEDLYSLSFGKG